MKRTAPVKQTDVEGRSTLAKPLSIFVGLLLLVLGVYFGVVGVAVWQGGSEKGTYELLGTVWGTTGVMTTATGIVLLGARHQAADATKRTRVARLALATGGAALIALIFTVVLGFAVSIMDEPAVSNTALYMTSPLGVVATTLGIWGIARAGGDGFSKRWSVAGLTLGATAALIPIWLWVNHPTIFTSLGS